MLKTQNPTSMPMPYVGRAAAWIDGQRVYDTGEGALDDDTVDAVPAFGGGATRLKLALFHQRPHDDACNTPSYCDWLRHHDGGACAVQLRRVRVWAVVDAAV